MEKLEADLNALLAALKATAEAAVPQLEADVLALVGLPMLSASSKAAIEEYKTKKSAAKGAIDLAGLLALMQTLLAEAPQLAASIAALLALFGK